MKKITGLTDEEVIRSRETHGSNLLKKEKTKSFIRRFFDNLSDPIIRILLIALGVQILVTLGNINYVEIFGIISAILISATVSTTSEYKSERAFEKLEADSLNVLVSVERNSQIVEIPSSDLVVGDIVYLNAGDKIQADGILLDGKISVDQSALNGESIEVVKIPGKDSGWDLASKHRVFRGSLILEGTAVMRVGRVGTDTYYGLVAKDVQSETRESPLKLRLAKFASQISKLGYIVAAVVCISYLFSTIVIDNQFDGAKIVEFIKDGRNFAATLIHAFTLMITVIVVAAPEGLPMMITVVLSANMKRMLADNVLVKKLVGIETAGSMNILFTDKTGTITEGKPQCDRFITNEGSYKTLTTLKKSGEIFNVLNLSAKYNTDVITGENGIVGGNATDRAIYDFFSSEKSTAMEVLSKTPFTSERKYSSVRLKNGKTIIKGGAELILSATKSVLDSNGREVMFDSGRFYEEYTAATKRGERVLAVAICEGAEIKDLTLVALIAMKDKIRAGVKESVKSVIRAGIQIVMITGDSKDTAVAIATECEIFNPNAAHIAIDAKELHEMSDEELKEILPKIRVVSRALPHDKTRLVRLSQEIDLVVGMTGDGINDAPSLKLADVGFGMGSGADIAKSAADIVILDNSFKAISKTVLYGRTIFKSIRKFITFQLIMNFVACGVSLVGQFIGIDTPITIIQMLWVNIIMDTLGGLAFSGEAPLEYYMFERPKDRNEPILSRKMLSQILLCGAFTLTLCLVFLTSPNISLIYVSREKLYTAFYALFIFFGIFNCFVSRCERMWFLSNITRNKRFVFIMLLISVIQIIMIYYGGEVFRCVPLTAKELWLALSISFMIIPFDIIRRIMVKLK